MYFAFRTAFGVCLVLAGGTITVLVVWLALETKRSPVLNCCGTVLGTGMVVYGGVILIPHRRPSVWDDDAWDADGEW